MDWTMIGSNARQDEPTRRGSVELDTDVLVLGGGPAATWAAWSAASQGARVVLVDKGYSGTSGATAPSGVGVWYVPPEPRLREEARASREALGGFLSERTWMDRVLDCTYDNVRRLGDWGYPFPTDDTGLPAWRSLQGPEYMRLMRKRVKGAGVRILDHSPALELLVDDHGVAGAAGVSRQEGLDYRMKAHAVVIATGGCAFLNGALGCNVLTGDGGLLAAERLARPPARAVARTADAGRRRHARADPGSKGCRDGGDGALDVRERAPAPGVEGHAQAFGLPRRGRAQQRRLHCGGLDSIWVRPERAANTQGVDEVAAAE